MRRLTILRHAKSSWAEPGMADHDRTLNERGHRQANALAKHFTMKNLAIEKLLCSSATRTRETLALIRPALNGAQEIIVPRLYEGSADIYLDEAMAADCDHVMLIGHNPTCDELVHALAAHGNEAAERLFATHYSTCNWTTLAFDGPFAAGKGVVEHFVQPKDLLEQMQ